MGFSVMLWDAEKLVPAEYWCPYGSFSSSNSSNCSSSSSNSSSSHSRRSGSVAEVIAIAVVVWSEM